MGGEESGVAYSLFYIELLPQVRSYFHAIQFTIQLRIGDKVWFTQKANNARHLDVWGLKTQSKMKSCFPNHCRSNDLAPVDIVELSPWWVKTTRQTQVLIGEPGNGVRRYMATFILPGNSTAWADGSNGLQLEKYNIEKWILAVLVIFVPILGP